MTDDEIDALVGTIDEDYDENFRIAQKNGLLLTPKQIKTLERYGIDPGKCGSTRELLYMIDQALDGSYEDECEDLSNVAETLDETRYYEEIRR